MKFFTRVFLSILTLLTLISVNAEAALVDKIKAVVNNEVITQGEVDKLLYPIYLRYKDIYDGKELTEKLDEAAQEILAQLIDDRLLLSEARKQGIEVSDREIDQKIDELEARFTGDRTLSGTLREQNLTINDVRKRYAEQMMIEKLVDARIRHQIQILPQENESYYREHIEEFTEPEQVKVGSILIRTGDNRTKEETLTLAVEILRRLKDGEDFYAMARNYSEGMNAEAGGDMGYVRKGQMVENIDKAIFALNIDEFTDLVETPLGFYIFKAYDRKKERTVPMAEVRPHIMDAIYREKVEVKFKEWLDELKKDAFISIK